MSSKPYTLFFTGQGLRGLEHQGVTVRLKLRSEEDVKRAILEHEAMLFALALVKSHERRAPKPTWKSFRAALFAHYPALRPQAAYRICRKMWGRLRDMTDPRQLTLGEAMR